MRVIIKETRTSIKPKEDPPLHSFRVWRLHEADGCYRVWRLHDAQLLQRVPAARRGGNDCKRSLRPLSRSQAVGSSRLLGGGVGRLGRQNQGEGEQAGSGPILINDRDGYSIKNARALLRQLEYRLKVSIVRTAPAPI